MAQAVGQLRLVDQLEPSSGRDPAVWRAWDDVAHRYVVVDLRLPASLLEPREDLDARLATVPGLLAPSWRLTGGAPAVVALVEPLRPRRTLAAVGTLPDDVVVRVLDQTLLALHALHEAGVSLGVITARSLVLVRAADADDAAGAGSNGGTRLLLSTASASEGSPASARRRDLEQLLDVAGRLAPRPGQGLARFLDDARRGLRSSATDSAAQVREALRRAEGTAAVTAATDAPATASPAAASPSTASAAFAVPLPVVPPLPPLPRGWDEQGRSAAAHGSEPVTRVRERRVRPADVAVLVLVLVCIAGVLLTSGRDGSPGAAPGSQSTPTTGTSVTTGPDGVATTVPAATGPATLAPPAPVASLGGPCGFFDVGVIETAGDQQLTCRKQSDGTYLWERDVR